MSVTYLGETDFRNRHVRFGIKSDDRLSHLYLIGKTGVGKSTLIEMVARQDLVRGNGFALVDPHGDLAEQMRDASVASGRPFVYLDAAASDQPFGYNPLHRVREDRIPLAVSGLLDAMKKLWPEAWGVRMEHVLRNTLYALIEREDSVLADIPRLYADKGFRQTVVRQIRNDIVRTFWTHEFAKYPDRQRAEAVAPIQNKIGALLTDPRLYRALVAPQSPISFRRTMDEGEILIANLARGRLGTDSADVLGSLLVATIAMAALSRADVPAEKRRPFFLYIDEFQSFTTLTFANMMPELRKYGVGLGLAHQHLHQLEEGVRHSVLGNAGTLIAFRVGPIDAPLIAREMAPVFSTHDLLYLPNHHYYLKLMIDGMPSRPFSARTFVS